MGNLELNVNLSRAPERTSDSMSDHPDPQIDPPDVRWLRSFGLVLQVGLMVVSGAVLGVAAGLLLKRYFGTGGLVMVICICSGTGAGLVGAFRLLVKEIDA
jgi:hypothetical protein